MNFFQAIFLADFVAARLRGEPMFEPEDLVRVPLFVIVFGFLCYAGWAYLENYDEEHRPEYGAKLIRTERADYFLYGYEEAVERKKLQFGSALHGWIQENIEGSVDMLDLVACTYSSCSYVNRHPKYKNGKTVGDVLRICASEHGAVLKGRNENSGDSAD